MRASNRKIKSVSSVGHLTALKPFVIVGSVVSGILVSMWLFQASDVVRHRTMHQGIKRLERHIQELQEKNQKLKVEIRQVEQDPFTLEAFARTQLGFVRKNEIVYQLVESE